MNLEVHPLGTGERLKALEEALAEIAALEGEINPSNYDHDDVCELNRQFCYAGSIADRALLPDPPQAIEQVRAA